MVLLFALPASASAQTLIQEPVFDTRPDELIYDNAGNRWYVNSLNSTMGKVAPDGSLIQEFGVTADGNGNGPRRFVDPARLLPGAGGYLWYTSSDPNVAATGLGRIDPGALSNNFAYFPIPNSGAIDTDAERAQFGLAFEPPNTMWFTLPNADHVGRAIVNSAGTPAYTLYSLGFCCHRQPEDIAIAGGFVWIAQADGIGRMNLNGTGYTTFSDGLTDPDAGDIEAGPDGNVYFTLPSGGRIGRITPAGQITEFPLQPTSNPTRLDVGADGNLWVALTGVDKVARVSLTGAVAEFSLPPSDGPVGMAAGPAGYLSFALIDPPPNRNHRLARLPFDLSPQVTTGAGSGTGPTAASVAGTVHPRASVTQYVFEYGPTTAYGSETAPLPAGSGDAPVDLVATIAGLQPGTTYHFRLKASNSFGTATGADATFTTGAADADGDGVVNGPDCNDADAKVKPGATDIPGNGIDEDCANGDAPFPVLRASVSVTWAVFANFTRLGRFRATELAGGERIRLRCKGRGCPFKAKSVKARKAGTLNLFKHVRKGRFRKGSVLQAFVSKPGHVGRHTKLTFRRAKAPKLVRRCLAPGSSKPRACPA